MTEHNQVFYRMIKDWHVLSCPDVDPKLYVVEKEFNVAVYRAEVLFGIDIPIEAA